MEHGFAQGRVKSESLSKQDCGGPQLTEHSILGTGTGEHWKVFEQRMV